MQPTIAALTTPAMPRARRRVLLWSALFLLLQVALSALAMVKLMLIGVA